MSRVRVESTAPKKLLAKREDRVSQMDGRLGTPGWRSSLSKGGRPEGQDVTRK